MISLMVLNQLGWMQTALGEQMQANKLFVADTQQQKAAARRAMPAVQRRRYDCFGAEWKSAMCLFQSLVPKPGFARYSPW